MRSVGHESHQCDQPECKFLVLEMESEQLQQIGFDYIVVTEDDAHVLAFRFVVPQIFDEIFDGLLAEGSLDVCFELLAVSDDGIDAAQTLHCEQYLVFELLDVFLLLEIYFDVVVVVLGIGEWFDVIVLVERPAGYVGSFVELVIHSVRLIG